MITKDDVVRINLDASQMKTVVQQSKLSTLNGSSNVHSGERRKETCFENQISGHACHLAASLHLYGSDEKYLEQRLEANAHPHEGDDGIDFFCSTIDVKGGMKRTTLPLRKYHLVVPKSEYHLDRVYVSALTDKFDIDKIEELDSLRVFLFGWAHSHELKLVGKEYMRGVFDGKYVIRNGDLNLFPVPECSLYTVKQGSWEQGQYHQTVPPLATTKQQ